MTIKYEISLPNQCKFSGKAEGSNLSVRLSTRVGDGPDDFDTVILHTKQCTDSVALFKDEINKLIKLLDEVVHVDPKQRVRSREWLTGPHEFSGASFTYLAEPGNKNTAYILRITDCTRQIVFNFNFCEPIKSVCSNFAKQLRFFLSMLEDNNY